MKKIVKKVAVLLAMAMSMVGLMACGSAGNSEKISEAQDLLDNCDGICIIYGNNAEQHSIAGASYTFYVNHDTNETLFQVVVGPEGQKQGLENKTYKFHSVDEFNGLVEVLKGMKPLAQLTDEVTEEEISTAEPYITIAKFNNENYNLNEADTYWVNTSKGTELEKYLKKVYDSCE